MVYESDGLILKPKAKEITLVSVETCIYSSNIYEKLLLLDLLIASNYRGNSNSEGKEEFGGADVNDVLNLIPALSQIEEQIPQELVCSE